MPVKDRYFMLPQGSISRRPKAGISLSTTPAKGRYPVRCLQKIPHTPLSQEVV